MAQGAKNARNKIVAYKCILYSAALFILGVFQVSFFGSLRLFGAVPDLLLGALITLAVYEEHKVVSICGIVSGFVYTALGGFSYPIYILFSFLMGYVFWGVSEKVFSKNYPSYLALSVFAFGAKGLYNLVELALSASSFSLISAFIKIVLPEFAVSMLFCSISYFIFYGLTRIFNSKNKNPMKGTRINER